MYILKLYMFHKITDTKVMKPELGAKQPKGSKLRKVASEMG